MIGFSINFLHSNIRSSVQWHMWRSEVFFILTLHERPLVLNLNNKCSEKIRPDSILRFMRDTALLNFVEIE